MVSKRLLLEVLEDVLTKLFLQTVAVESEEALQTIPVGRGEERKGNGRERREAVVGGRGGNGGRGRWRKRQGRVGKRNR